MASTSSNDRNKIIESRSMLPMITAADRRKLIELRRSILYPPWSSSTEEVMGTNDLLRRILLRLPGKSLVRFKLVNRQWRDLILDTKFARDHFGFNTKPPISGLYCGDMDPPYPIPLQGHSLPLFDFAVKPEQSHDGYYRIHDSRHGLFVCSYITHRPDYSIQTFVCNPTTQQYKFFPELVLKTHEHIYLSFDPSVSLTYKLIYIDQNVHQYDIVIYLSDYSTPKIIHFEADQFWGRHLLEPGVLASDGIIYVMTTHRFLVKFDVEKEELSATRMANKPKFKYESDIAYFGEKDAENLVVIAPGRFRGLDFIIYEMAKLEGRTWVEKHHIDFTQELPNSPVLEQPIPRMAIMYVFWDDKNEERDLTFLIGVSGKAILYNYNKKETKVICDLPCYPSARGLPAHPFIGSLLAI